MSPRSILVTPPFLDKRQKKNQKKICGHISEILDLPLVDVVAMAGARGSGEGGGRSI